MSILSGKKALCFIALPHHNRFLVPMMEALSAQGMATDYFTAAAEGAFEITLNQAKLPYRHIYDYADDDTSARANAAFRMLRGQFQQTLLESHTLQAVPVVIQDKTMRAAVDNFHCLDQMLRQEQPDVLFALHELNPWGKMLGYLSHVHRIPYFTLQEGLYYSHVFYHRFHTDYSTACMVWGEACKQTLVQAGCGADKIYPLGNTQIWTAKGTHTSAAMVQRTRAALGISADKKIVLLLMSHNSYQPFDARPLVDWMRARGDVVTVVKWHPITAKDVIERALSKHRQEPLMINAQDGDTYALLGASDVCVTVGNSTTALEALVYGKPLVEVRLADQEYSFAARGVAEAALGFEGLVNAAEALLIHGRTAERTAQVEKYLDDNFAHRDGRTLERMVRLVEESIGARQQGAKASLTGTDGVSFPCTLVLPVDDVMPQSLLATLEALAANTAAELFEIVIVNCAANSATRQVLASLGGDVTVLEGSPAWSYAAAGNRAAEIANGKYLAFLKPGVLPSVGWLDALFAVAEADPKVGVVGAQSLDSNGMIWHIGYAFDVNQSPFPIYRLLPADFAGAKRTRQFRAVAMPFMVSRELFRALGGFNEALHNRFEDVDFCLTAKRAGHDVVYAPESRIIVHGSSWQPSAERDVDNRIRFYSRWTGHLWQNDEELLQEDNLSHDGLSTLYQQMGRQIATGVGASALAVDP
jgi:GT2 family glycosyltransferase